MADYLEVQLVERIDLIVPLDVLMKEWADGSTAEEFLTKFVVVQAAGCFSCECCCCCWTCLRTVSCGGPESIC